MADIFLSYAREDADRAATLVQALKGAGLSVWFDRYTPTASKWENILKREIEQARCVLMLWSNHAATSHWVREEGMAGLERAVLVPVRITEADIPEAFGSIQFADLTSWDGDPAASVLTELLRCIRSQMLPHCQIVFDSLLQLRADSLKELYEAYLHIADRVGGVPAAQDADGHQRLNRAVASLQVSVEWDSVLKSWYADPARQKAFRDRVRRIERHIPLIWLRLLDYSGPFFDSSSSPRAHANFLLFASMMFFHEIFFAARSVGQHIDIPSPLTEGGLKSPRWEGMISSVFDSPDEIARAYVTHIDDCPLTPEEVFYGPKYRSQRAYGKSIDRALYTDPVWLEQYVIPQRELRLALEGSTQDTKYGGNARVRKVTDLSGDDLEPLFE